MLRFQLPDIGEGVVEAEVVEWRVAEGDVVGVDQVLAVLMTDKATFDLPSPVAGRVHRLLAAPGAVVALTGPLCEGRPRIDGQDTAYVCRQFVCDAPTTDPEVLARQLR